MRFLVLGGALGLVVAFLLRNRDAVRGMLDQTPLNKVRAQNLEEMTKDELYERAQRADIQGRSDMTKDELYERAQKADIPGRSEMTKGELIEALRSAS